ncbi:MAG: M48 family metallopeptidase, partial [Pricia sp.]
MNTLFYTIIIILLAQFILETVLDYLNAKRYDRTIPEELRDVFDADEYQKSQAYKKTNYRFGLLTSTFSLLLTLSFLIFGGFEWVDQIARSISENPVVVALVFFGIIMIGSDIITLPFSYYSTFVIEEKFGFNKTTTSTFFLDKLKGWAIMAVVGGGLLALIIWFFDWAGTTFWIYAWALVTIFTIFMNLFYSKLIVPLFNKLTPLEAGGLKTKIENYAENVGFELQHIFV